jgi:hypothetical protein
MKHQKGYADRRQSSPQRHRGHRAEEDREEEFDRINRMNKKFLILFDPVRPV